MTTERKPTSTLRPFALLVDSGNRSEVNPNPELRSFVERSDSTSIGMWLTEFDVLVSHLQAAVDREAELRVAAETEKVELEEQFQALRFELHRYREALRLASDGDEYRMGGYLRDVDNAATMDVVPPTSRGRAGHSPPASNPASRQDG